jgi:sulfonate transport system substrate-binding protein
VAATVAIVAVALIVAPARASTRHTNDDKNQKVDLSDVTLRVTFPAARDTSTQDIWLASKAFDNTPYAIKWALLSSSTLRLEALSAGAVDVAADTMATSLMIAQSGAKTPWTRSTVPFTAVAASVAPPAAGAVIGVRPGSGIRKVADLKGKKVSYARGGVSQLYWAIASREAKLKKGDVQVVELAPADGRAAFLSGAVDALVGQHTTLIPLVSSGDAEVIAESKGAVPEYRLTLVRAGLLDDKKQAAAVADFLERLNRAKRWILNHPKETAAVYQKSASVTPEDAKAAIAEMPNTVLPLDGQLAKLLQNQAKIFYDDGVTPTNPKLSILFDRRYVTTADRPE